MGVLSARYRDNFFVVLPEEWTHEELNEVAELLTEMLLMPVKLERWGREIRCLEIRLLSVGIAAVRHSPPWVHT